MNLTVSSVPRRSRARSVHVVTAVWAVAAYALLLKVAAASGGTPRVSGQVAGNLVMTTVGRAAPVVGALGALLLVVLAGLFWCGVRAAFVCLVAVALLLLVLPGVSGTYEAVVLMVALVLGTAPLLLDHGLDHLAGEGRADVAA